MFHIFHHVCHKIYANSCFKLDRGLPELFGENMTMLKSNIIMVYILHKHNCMVQPHGKEVWIWS